MIPRSFPLTLVLSTLAAPALADEPAVAPTQVVENAAADWLAKGNKAFKEGRFAEAEQAYREAFALKQGYDIAGNLGAAEMAQGKLKEAAQHLAFTLRLFPLTGDPALRERMSRALEQCKRGLGAVRIKAPKGSQVAIDGTPASEIPLPDELYLDPGEHTFTATLPGHTAAPQRLHLDAGTTTEVALTLTPTPPPRRPTPQPRSLVPGLALGAVSLVGLAGGATFLALSASRRTDADTLRTTILRANGSCVPAAPDHDPRCPTLAANLGARDTLHDAAVGAFLAGSLAAAGTAAYFLWPTGRPVRVTPLFGEASGAVMVSGSF